MGQLWVSHVGLESALSVISTAWGPVEYKLFVNDWAESGDFDAADFVEPTDGGYSQIAREFDFPVQEGDVWVRYASICTWTFLHDGGDVTIRGYFVRGQDLPGIVLAKKLDVPRVITLPGEVFQVLPRVASGRLLE